MAACSSDSPLSALHVKDAMSRTLVTCRAEDPVAEAERSMGLHQVRRLRVVGRGSRLEGLLTLDDIAAEARREKGLIAPPVGVAAVGQTPWARSAARASSARSSAPDERFVGIRRACDRSRASEPDCGRELEPADPAPFLHAPQPPSLPRVIPKESRPWFSRT
jgi:hypothetical protein